ncbi:MHFG family PEP-CTERM protein [Aquincola sp. MAHUQ-54]|uniref:MHFG family PEP-CTERM protein n=1 Tax=Aquincola agrisoli TaxID=3119538 RepID=A0AAW9QBJ9_9BURK
MNYRLIACSVAVALVSWGACAQAQPTPPSATVKPPSTVRVDNCSWDKPGHNPFMGDLVAAVDRYSDIPPDVRARLKKRMATREYDDLVTIQRDSIAGKQIYESGIRDMHFGTNRVCGTVTRDKWSPAMQERGLVYCESGHCILVPTVCRNVSRITRASGGGGGAASGPGELTFDPPAAGQPAVAEAPADPLDELPPPSAGPLALPGTGLAEVPQGPADIVAPNPFYPGSPLSPGGPIYVPTPPLVPPGSLPPTPAVPEPGTWLMMAGGIALLTLYRQRRLKQQARRA